MMRILAAALIMGAVVAAGLFAIPVAVQLWPGERPGICGRACYGSGAEAPGLTIIGTR